MSTFLFWIGFYNVLGSFVVAAMHYEKIADAVLRKGTEFIAQPYKHEGYSRFWMWWAAMANLFIGAIMVRAAKWPLEIQREVTIAACGVYFIGWLCVVFGMRRPRYGRGMYSAHPLWLGQIAWGMYGLVESY